MTPLSSARKSTDLLCPEGLTSPSDPTAQVIALPPEAHSGSEEVFSSWELALLSVLDPSGVTPLSEPPCPRYQLRDTNLLHQESSLSFNSFSSLVGELLKSSIEFPGLSLYC